MSLAQQMLNMNLHNCVSRRVKEIFSEIKSLAERFRARGQSPFKRGPLAGEFSM